MGAASSCVVQASHGGGLLQSTGSMVCGFRQFLHVDSLPVVHRLRCSTTGGIIPDLVSNLAPTLPAEFFTMEPEKHCLAFYNGFPTEQI